jgi:predicted ATPase
MEWIDSRGERRLLQPLWNDGERVYCRTWRNNAGGAEQALMAVLPAAEQPALSTISRLAHEFALKDYLDGAWAARPLDLVQSRGRTLLLLECRATSALDLLPNRPLELEIFLRLAPAITHALGRLHERGLVHRDIKPAHILLDSVTEEIWLTGFGIASRVPRERQVPEPPEFIAGTLAYMSPEQTGRMNRSIDSRSDLYSLGVTFYQMLTGVLPFAATDPMEWVHCHIARTPVPPHERVGNIPALISQIVMKLVAKTAEERYQTAAGVEHDLRRCRTEWEMRGRIDEFPLAQHDVTDRLLIPEKLYGRSREVAALVSAFHQVVATGTPELILVSGYSGVGKSSVVNELHKALVPSRGLFASGKFDQYQRDIPYATVAQAFQSLVRQILSKSEAELQGWRDALCEALGPNGLLIVNLIPELELVIGEQPPVPDLLPQDAQRRFQMVLRRFIGVFARPEHPLALFLDDLQWLDAATLDLLEDILTQRDIRHLLLIGAYRDNEVDTAHPLMRRLDAIRRAGAAVQDIVLAPLAYDDLEQLISDSLHCESQPAGPLVQLVQEKTGGNPFFAIQFLSALADEALLVFDDADARWICDLNRIRAKRYTDNVVDLMVVKLNRLPPETQAPLRQLACVGAGAAYALLATVCQSSQEELHENLWEAVRTGLVLRSEDSYAFQHDRIREAAYSLIPEEARAEAHLRRGRLLLAHTPPDKREEIIFEIVSQFNRSLTLVTSRDEREQLAQLNLIAGKRAKNAAAYSSALTYFATGRVLLAEDCWMLQCPLTFQLELNRAECEFLTGESAGAEERLSMLASRATNLVDLAAVTCLRVDLYAVLGRSDRAVVVSLEYLQQVGVEWSPHPTDEDVRQEYERIWDRIGSRPIEILIDSPLMSDVGTRATLDVLTKMMPSTQCTDEKLLCLIIMRMVNLSLEYGNCNASCCGYVWFGLILSSYFENYTAAYRFGRLSLDLVEKRGLDAFKARVYEAFGIFVSPWAEHVRSGRAFVQQAFSEANRIGDLTYASIAATISSRILLRTANA